MSTTSRDAYPDNDDAASDHYLSELSGVSGIWQPECWSKSPEQLQSEARAMNLAAYSSSCAAGTKHSNPSVSHMGRRL